MAMAHSLLKVSNSVTNGFTQRFADAFNRNAVEYLLKESGDNHPHRLLASIPASHRIEQLRVVHATRGAAVRTTDVVGVDFSADMVAEARRKTPSELGMRVRFDVADADTPDRIAAAGRRAGLAPPTQVEILGQEAP
jgi:SAM-dependent methyltransferase